VVNVVALHRAELPDRVLLPLLFVRSKILLPVVSLCSQLLITIPGYLSPRPPWYRPRSINDNHG
jgi:hypothetical protein